MWKTTFVSEAAVLRGRVALMGCTIALLMLPTLVSSSTSSFSSSKYFCSFSDPLVVGSHAGGNVNVQHYVNVDEGTLTMKVTTKADVKWMSSSFWMGIGIHDPEEDLPPMTLVMAVIGRNDDDGGAATDSHGPHLREYVLSSKNHPVYPDAQEGLVEATFEQSETLSTLTFTQKLHGLNQVTLTEETQWLYAIGYTDDDSYAIPQTNMDAALWGAEGQLILWGRFQISLASPTCTTSPTRLNHDSEEHGPVPLTPLPRLSEETVQRWVQQEVDDDLVEEQLDAAEDAADDAADAAEDAADDAADAAQEEADADGAEVDEEEEVGAGEQPTTTVPPSDGGGQVQGNCPFSLPIALDSAGELELEQYVDEATNTFTMKLPTMEVRHGSGWGSTTTGFPPWHRPWLW